MHRLIPTVVLLLVVSPTLAVEHTVVLQQGLDGYAGVADTWADTNDWDSPPQDTVNYGLNEIVRLDRNDGSSPLLRFDLSSIPANSQVTSATLELYNTTDSSYSGTQSFARRVRVHRMLVAWDEGNQVGSPINSPGEHGATGFYAVQYFPGEGTDVAWHGAEPGVTSGLAADADYVAAEEDLADVVDEGWYSWDLTSLVQAWVRGTSTNRGVVLRDATGYQDDHVDWRSFVSSQGTTTAQRPRLVVTYNPDTPLASAGGDVEELAWNGGPVTLDGSGSDDHPGGDPSSLTFSWSIITAAHGSQLTGELGTSEVLAFQPDVAGEYDLQLTVTNVQNETATDTVHVRVLAVSASHPRLFLTPEKLTALRARAVPSNPRWSELLAEANAADGAMHAKALVSQVLEVDSYCDEAITAAIQVINDGYTWSSQGGELATVYDWCHHRLSTGEQTAFLDAFHDFAEDPDLSEDSSGWGNYWPRWSYSFALAGLAAYGDDPDAQSWFDEYRHARFRDLDRDALDRIAAGGGWPEGTVYDWIANRPRMLAVAAWHTATGEDLFLASDWFADRLDYLLMLHLPGVAEEWGDYYHPYLSRGDGERYRGSMANYGRIMSLVLTERFADDPRAHRLHAYLDAAPDLSMEFLAAEEFLFYDPDVPTTTPDLLAHHAEGLGTVLVRSGWPDGAADTDTNTTVITFQCGDHYTYHQHWEQNGFTLYRGAPLIVDAGVYSGDGLSYHDRNYYVRTVAHNTLLVDNPDENFEASRPGAESNDGGQRSVYPASRSPQSVEYWDVHADQYETGDIVAFEHSDAFTYVRGDATAAYNNPTYNQAMDGGGDYADSVAKVDRFQRELVYLRSGAAGANELVLLYDRVGITQPSFSGAATKLLFHTIGEPQVDGTGTVLSPGETLYDGATSASATTDGHPVELRFLLPADRAVRKVGGRDVKSFWVRNTNYDWHWSDSEPQPRPTSDFEDEPFGEWRLQLEPTDTALSHAFLTAIAPSDQVPPLSVVSGAGVEGVAVASAGESRVVLFSSASDGAPPTGPITYAAPGGAPTRHVLANLVPGSTWSLVTSRNGNRATIELSENSGGALQASSAGVLQFLLDAPVTCDLNGSGSCGAGDAAELVRAISDLSYLPSNSPDLNRDGDRDGADTELLLGMCYEAP